MLLVRLFLPSARGKGGLVYRSLSYDRVNCVALSLRSCCGSVARVGAVQVLGPRALPCQKSVRRLRTDFCYRFGQPWSPSLCPRLGEPRSVDPE